MKDHNPWLQLFKNHFSNHPKMLAQPWLVFLAFIQIWAASAVLTLHDEIDDLYKCLLIVPELFVQQTVY
jgi:hypothetical protein